MFPYVYMDGPFEIWFKPAQRFRRKSCPEAFNDGACLSCKFSVAFGLGELICGLFIHACTRLSLSNHQTFPAKMRNDLNDILRRM